MQELKDKQLRAKECIVVALIELMKQEEFDHISITDITAKAGVSRMAYYRNYTSKEDILNSYMYDIGKSIHDKLPKIDSEERLREYFYELFVRLGEHSDLGIAIFHANLGGLVLENINAFFMETFSCIDSSDKDRMKIRIMAGAFYNVFSEWIKNGRKESPMFLAELGCTMINMRSIPKS